MILNFLFFANSILLGVGLAMDAFSVSLVNGLNAANMNAKQELKIAGAFAAFQGLMPTIGWLFVNTILQYFERLEKAIPWISFALLLFIGGKKNPQNYFRAGNNFADLLLIICIGLRAFSVKNEISCQGLLKGS